MANEIYHRTNWGEAKPEGFGDIYFDPSATNKLYNRSTYYENSDATDKILGDIPNKASIVLTPTAYSENKIGSAIPVDGNGDFTFARNSSATRVNQAGLIEASQSNDTPRLDYTTGQGAFLLEPSSTNLVTYSEDFTQSSWSKFRVTLTGGFASPDGLNNAYKFVSNTETGTHYIADSTTNSGSASSISFFIKQKGQTIAGVGHGIGGSEIAYFDLANGVTLTKGSSVTSSTMKEYPNGWYKCSITFTSVNNPRYAIVFGTNADNTNSYAGDGVNGILIYGSQYEVLSYPTSYIPTTGSTVTRAAETANSSGNSDLFNSTEGVLYAEIAALSDDGTNRQIAVSDGSLNNRVYLGLRRQSNQIIGAVIDGGTGNFLNHTISDTTTNFKIALKYKVNDLALFFNGTKVETDTSATMPSGLNELAFDNGNGFSDFYGKVKGVAVFKEALSDAELIELTS